MKKTTTLAIFMALCSIGLFYQLNAQSPYSPDRYMLVFDAGTAQTYIDDLMLELNSEQVWVSPLSDVHLCEVKFFPFTINEGGFLITITDINEVIDRAKKKSKVTGGDYDFIANIEPFNRGTGREPADCQGQFDLDNALGAEIVRIGIFDTGISSTIGSTGQFAIDNYTGRGYVDASASVLDDNGHGTHVAGSIAGVNYIANSFYPSSRIEYDIRKTHDDEGYGYISDVILALDESILQADIRIATMCFSYYAEPEDEPVPFEIAIQTAAAEGVLVIASAGNDHHDNDAPDLRAFPASFRLDNIVSVASVDCAENLSIFSNYGETNVDLATIGEGVEGPDLVGGIKQMSGTSQAAALTSAVAIGMSTRQTIADPEAIKCALLEGTTLVTELEDFTVTGGVLNASNALQRLLANSCSLAGTNSEADMEVMTSSEWRISPNPFTDQLFIQTEQTVPAMLRWQIYNLMGQQLAAGQAQLEAGDVGVAIDLRQVEAKGALMLHVMTDTWEDTRVVVKE